MEQFRAFQVRGDRPGIRRGRLRVRLLRVEDGDALDRGVRPELEERGRLLVPLALDRQQCRAVQRRRSRRAGGNPCGSAAPPRPRERDTRGHDEVRGDEIGARRHVDGAASGLAGSLRRPLECGGVVRLPVGLAAEVEDVQADRPFRRRAIAEGCGRERREDCEQRRDSVFQGRFHLVVCRDSSARVRQGVGPGDRGGAGSGLRPRGGRPGDRAIVPERTAGSLASGPRRLRARSEAVAGPRYSGPGDVRTWPGRPRSPPCPRRACPGASTLRRVSAARANWSSRYAAMPRASRNQQAGAVRAPPGTARSARAVSRARSPGGAAPERADLGRPLGAYSDRRPPRSGRPSRGRPGGIRPGRRAGGRARREGYPGEAVVGPTPSACGSRPGRRPAGRGGRVLARRRRAWASSGCAVDAPRRGPGLARRGRPRTGARVTR